MPNHNIVKMPTKMSDFYRQSEFETIVNEYVTFKRESVAPT
jgi:hypothetical protein